MKNRILIALCFIVVTVVAFGVVSGAYTLSPDPDTAIPVFAPAEIRIDSMYNGSISLANVPHASSGWGSQEYFNSNGDLVVIDDTTSVTADGVTTYTRHIQTPDLGDLVSVSYVYRNVDPWFLRSSAVYRESDIVFGFTGFSNGRCTLYVEYSYYDSDGYFREGLAKSTILGVTDTYTFDVRNDLVELLDNHSVPYGSTGFYIDALRFDFDTPNSVFASGVTYTAVEGGELGVGISPRYLPDIRKNYVDPNIFGWLKNSVQAFLDTPIFGEGLTFGGVVAVLIAFPLVVWFLKLVAGG